MSPSTSLRTFCLFLRGRGWSVRFLMHAYAGRKPSCAPLSDMEAKYLLAGSWIWIDVFT